MKLTKDQLTEHFRLSEFACGGEMIITPEFMTFVTDALEPFRVWYNRPININSGYRTVAKNRVVGGVPASLHLRAMAVDFDLPADYINGSAARKEQYIENIRKKWDEICISAGGYGQICRYNTYLHLGLSWQHEYFEDKRGK